jgi:CBS domain-containing protein
MFELTGNFSFVMPIAYAVLVSRAVASLFVHGGIFDEHIGLRGLAYVAPAIIPQTPWTAADVMLSHGFSVIDVDANTVQSLSGLLVQTNRDGFPVVSKDQAGVMLCHGFITRTSLQTAVSRARRRKLPEHTQCYFSSAIRVPTANVANQFDLSPFLQPAPIEVLHNTPLVVVVDLFTQLNLSCCLVIREGCLVGIITREGLAETLRTQLISSSLLSWGKNFQL